MTPEQRRAEELLADPDQRTRGCLRPVFAEHLREKLADQLEARDWASLCRTRASEDLAELGRMVAGYIDRATAEIVANERDYE